MSKMGQFSGPTPLPESYETWDRGKWGPVFPFDLPTLMFSLNNIITWYQYQSNILLLLPRPHSLPFQLLAPCIRMWQSSRRRMDSEETSSIKIIFRSSPSPNLLFTVNCYLQTQTRVLIASSPHLMSHRPTVQVSPSAGHHLNPGIISGAMIVKWTTVHLWVCVT